MVLTSPNKTYVSYVSYWELDSTENGLRRWSGGIRDIGIDVQQELSNVRLIFDLRSIQQIFSTTKNQQMCFNKNNVLIFRQLLTLSASCSARRLLYSQDDTTYAGFVMYGLNFHFKLICSLIQSFDSQHFFQNVISGDCELATFSAAVSDWEKEDFLKMCFGVSVEEDIFNLSYKSQEQVEVNILSPLINSNAAGISWNTKHISVLLG